MDQTQLFDLQNDPRELTNLADKPQHAAKIVQLTALLEQEMAHYADTASLTVKNPKPTQWTPRASSANTEQKIEQRAKRKVKRQANAATETPGVQ